METLNTDILILIFKFLDYKSLFNIMSTSKYFFKITQKHYKSIYIDVLKKIDKKYLKELSFQHATSLKILYEKFKIYDIIINKYDNEVPKNLFYNILNKVLIISHYKYFSSLSIIGNEDITIEHKLYKYLLKGDLIVYLDNNRKIKNIEVYTI
jgi:hypothetical protein